jgi:hypothetical protein
MSYIGGELSDEMKVIELPRLAFVPLLLEGVGNRLMVSEDHEVTRFQHVAKMLHGQKLPIVGAVCFLCRVELLGEECQWLSGVVNTLLQHGTHGGSRGVCDECKLSGWLAVPQ